MKVAVLYGKGPTFGDHPAGDVRPDLQIAINQAGWFVPGVDAVVCCDRAPKGLDRDRWYAPTEKALNADSPNRFVETIRGGE